MSLRLPVGRGARSAARFLPTLSVIVSSPCAIFSHTGHIRLRLSFALVGNRLGVSLDSATRRGNAPRLPPFYPSDTVALPCARTRDAHSARCFAGSVYRRSTFSSLLPCDLRDVSPACASPRAIRGSPTARAIQFSDPRPIRRQRRRFSVADPPADFPGAVAAGHPPGHRIVASYEGNAGGLPSYRIR